MPSQAVAAEVMVERFVLPQLEVTQRERHDHAVGDERRAHAGAEAEVQHLAAFVAAEGLHAGVVHHPHRAVESVAEVEIDPARAEVVRFGDRPAVANLAGIADRDALDGQSAVASFTPSISACGVSSFPDGNFGFLGLLGLPDLDVGAADIDDEDVHFRRRIEGKLQSDR